jgi:hypothetical protein
MSRRQFGNTPSTFTLQKRHGVHPQQIFQPLPLPPGDAPYRLRLEDVLPADRIEAIHRSGKLVLHTTGDTGGIQSGLAQYIVAQHMAKDLKSHQDGERPAFFYHLGDIVYYYGEAEHYYPQFYEPYKGYDAPIFAIPGNHDGDVLDDQRESLAAFMDNFCATIPRITPEAGDASRHAMTQPNVYWTLQAPYATIIGLYTNVPEGGLLDQDQINWFQNEMMEAEKEKALIVAMHHPIYSGDIWHSGSAYLGEILDQTIQETGRIPDMVLAGHVHNYQRFTRQYKWHGQELQIPYIVAGAGGYFHLHHEQMLHGNTLQPGHHFAHEEATFECSCDDRHGFLRLEVTPNEIKGTYLTVPRPQEAWRAPAQPIDTFALDQKTHRMKDLAGVR